VKNERTILGHPVGLFILFFTEMWERFSYYGMRALLVLYMTDYLFLNPELGREVLGFTVLQAQLTRMFGEMTSQQLASQVYGLYTGFVYLTPLFGGMLADKLLGQRKTVLVGGILMAAGHFLMANERMFLVALFLLILGNGAFKPNVSTQVGTLYEDGDPRRDQAYTIYYMGINLGAFLAPLVCGTLGQVYGWHYGFTAAGVGMILGLIVYMIGQRYLAPDVLSTASAKETSAPLTPAEWRRVLALVALCGLNIVFWGVYEQQGNTMQLWADDRTDWVIFGWEMPSTWYQSFNPFMIFIFAPVLSIFWAWQSRRGREPSSVTKMAIGSMLLGTSFLIMIVAARTLPDDTRGSIAWLASTTFILTIGELYLSPIGLSLVTKAAPRRIMSMMMGMWFLSSFFGNYMSGYLGTFYGETQIEHVRFFGILAGLGFGSGLLMWMFNPPLRRALATRA
jgi:POT family proton-dependent oligopeptide transporter